MADLLRPLKTTGTRKYADEYANGQQFAKDVELDADLDTIYLAWNTMLPPMLAQGGPAGGDLAGTYPNPEIRQGAVGTDELAAGAITNDKITSVDWAKITGAPTSLPPGGTAGGDLSGTYPNPTVLKSTGAFTVGDTLNMAENKNILWTTAGGPVGRLKTWSTGIELTVNWPGAATSDSALYSKWRFSIDHANDRVSFTRAAAGDPVNISTFLILKWPYLELLGSASVAKYRWWSHQSQAFMYLTTNAKPNAGETGWTLDETNLHPAWFLWLSGRLGDEFGIGRMPAGSSGGNPTTLLKVAGTGTVRVTTDPVNALDLSTKQYVDARAFVDAPSDGQTYGRRNAAWSVVTGGGGGTQLWSEEATTGSLTPNVAETVSNCGLLLHGSPGGSTGDLRFKHSTLAPNAWFTGIGGDDDYLYFRAGASGIAFNTQDSDGLGEWTSTGNLILYGPGTVRLFRDPSTAMEAATKQYVDSKTGVTGPNRTVRTLAGGSTTLDATAEVHFASAISNATLPLANTCAGRIYEFAPANQINLSRSGSDTIVVGTAAGVTSLAITANMRVTIISDGISAWRVISSDPALSISGILAGGSLNGTYPNPGLAANSVSTSQLAAGSLSPSKLAGAVPSAGDAGKLLQFDTTNPTTQWKIAPASVTSGGTMDVPVQTSYQWGPRGPRGRLVAAGDADWVGMTVNRFLSTGNAWTADQGIPSWSLFLRADTDQFQIARSAAGAPTVASTLLALSNTGLLATEQYAFNGANAATGGAGLLQNYSTSGCMLACNNRWNPPATAKASWSLEMNADSDAYIVHRAAGAGAATQDHIFTFAAAGNLTISGGVATKATGTAWANPSDRRLKQDIDDYGPGLESLMFLRPRTWVFNGRGGSQAGLRGYGFIADEIEPTLPEMVRATRVRLDPDDEEETDIAALDTSNLVLVLVNAVKELAARVAILEAAA